MFLKNLLLLKEVLKSIKKVILNVKIIASQIITNYSNKATKALHIIINNYKMLY